MKIRKLELLSPAANSETAIQAVLHGADAVYIGPSSHGARKSASNSIEEIEKTVEFAHQYRAKVYATVNTLIYDDEIKKVEELCRDLYHAGVDALIVQDMGILRMKIPPIELHASTQCDIRTPEKAKFLEEVGFSQLVLARELTLKEIKNITDAVTIPVETFVHGALCVCYSGLCQASMAVTGRSANRGECAQLCRLPYTLTDSHGKVISQDKYLLSLKDFNASHNLEDLIAAGVSSFKIEGRLKDMSYVKNITAFYNNRLNLFIKNNVDTFCRASYGEVKIDFQPDVYKSFNRGFSNYFISMRNPHEIASLLTPKSMGEKIDNIKMLNNGDGISFFDKEGNFTGVNVNKIERGKIIPARKINIPSASPIYRTSDVKWNKEINGATGTRKLRVYISIDDKGINASDERGVRIRKDLSLPFEKARSVNEYRVVFEKLGNTPYQLYEFRSNLSPDRSYRLSDLSNLKRQIAVLLDKANKITYPFTYRRAENKDYPFPKNILDYRDNVANQLAKDFYMQHGVEAVGMAKEVTGKFKSGDKVMTTRYCILREIGLCKKEKGKLEKFKYPLYLNYQGGKFRLDFNCTSCEMHVIFE